MNHVIHFYFFNSPENTGAVTRLSNILNEVSNTSLKVSSSYFLPLRCFILRLNCLGFLQWPNDEDLTGAAMGLIRLQDTYALKASDISQGILWVEIPNI